MDGHSDLFQVKKEESVGNNWLEGVQIGTDEGKHNSRRKILATFLLSIPESIGWWYRLPQLNFSGKKPSRLGVEKNLLHLGCIFGLEEEATAIILYELGLMKWVERLKSFGMNTKGWESLRSYYNVPNKMINWSKSKIKLMNGKRESHWFIMCVHSPLNPIQIIAKKLYPPTKLVS
mmetsp:Transcript_22853/g.32221  ORF Transcript_22853/g.32221 Transcript_22853/m.32221 type:complete len:176 (-) Transcript_22853:816-1343(-)